MSKNISKVVFMVVMICSMLLAACAPAATPTPVPTTPAPAEPSVDPTGQTLSFWHVWGTGLPNETMVGIVEDFNASNEWGITVEAIDQGKYSNLEDSLTLPFNPAICQIWSPVIPMPWPTGTRWMLSSTSPPTSKMHSLV